ncbi:Rho GTPase activation protein [Rhizopus microsporus var. microsporus]|uniref:Rho GTPase activation protein n=2 Tax=Rhizopus microsporus TaxID=58291 RepID=A0A2G4T6F5_RHIZD|nr:Rho GTPase activation protein [Rhizopus microsporus ATCC 52813]ORE04435.1 Rho GTPase activation protein [Rhizopus microsporus var. microsporus]PHZ16588.1 Rho GTPase activation protein [Rhizopus microsporus ATCC 52813]
MVQAYGYPTTPNNQIVSRAVAAAAANSHHSGRGKSRNSKRYSVSAFYSMAAEQDNEVEDELAQAQRSLRELKSKISAQSKKNFVLERDVRYLDSRIALLIQNRIALDEQSEMASHLEEHGLGESDCFPDDRKMQQYGNFFFILQSEPRHIATLCRLVSLSEIDTLLQTVMFTLYGNQYESREEHLLLTMFQNVLAAQFETSTEFGSLLRANTPVSRMMTTYTRRGPGQSYLKSTLSKKISDLVSHQDLDLEINPIKVYDQMIIQIEKEQGCLPADLPKSVTPEVAASNQDVQRIIQPRLEKLIEIAEGFLDIILSSTAQVPYGIRWICKQIRSLTRRKSPHASENSVCSMIGGFFFLRFINPAIVTPRAYMLLDTVPGNAPRRTLTLVAKMLQNLANRPSYAKESYMLPTNPFVERNKQRINKFLNELCEVGDFYETLEMDQYMALSKRDIVISITLNEMYNTHALVERHLDVIAPKEKDHLRILMTELAPAPAQVSRKENKTIDLPLFSRWEVPIQDLTTALMSENNITQNDILYMETKAIYVQLIRSLPHLASGPLDLDYIAEVAATTKDAQLVRKGIKVKDMLKELEDAGVIDHKDHYKLLVEEITQELTHLGNLKEKVLQEIESLDGVYKTILDHNNYLRSQLESYKAYLQNVRIQSGGDKSSKVGIGVEVEGGHKPKKTHKGSAKGPCKFSHNHLEKDGVITESTVPENRRANIFFSISSPLPGTFIIAMHFKGREKPILEMDLKLDDLLEKQQDNVELLDLEYVRLNVSKTLSLLNKNFVNRNK